MRECATYERALTRIPSRGSTGRGADVLLSAGSRCRLMMVEEEGIVLRRRGGALLSEGVSSETASTISQERSDDEEEDARALRVKLLLTGE